MDIRQYLARSVIRHLNGDFKEFERLRGIALKIYEEEEYQKKCVCTIGELTPTNIRKEMYEIAKRGKRAC